MGGLTQEQLDWSLKNEIKNLPGVEAIAVERRRQAIVEGWTPEHDDTHADGEMAKAAACYAWAAQVTGTFREIAEWGDAVVYRRLWPWDASWWKPKTRREDLVRAGALIAAEIDRLDRLEMKPK